MRAQITPKPLAFMHWTNLRNLRLLVPVCFPSRCNLTSSPAVALQREQPKEKMIK